MRTHSDIVGNADAARKVANATGAGIHTVRSWGQRGSIPAFHWPALVDAELATLDELVASAPARRTTPKPEAAAA